MSRLFSFAGVTCIRGGRLLFDELDLIADPGHAIEISGPNGSGKSSLLRLAAGLLEPTAGIIRRDARVGLVDERLAFDVAQPLGPALAFWARVDGSATNAIDRALEALGIAHLAEVPVRLLSTGQRKRAAFVRLIASPARLWLLDEPLNGLDADGVARVTSVLRDHLVAGNAALFASHQPIAIDGERQRIELGR